MIGPGSDKNMMKAFISGPSCPIFMIMFEFSLLVLFDNAVQWTFVWKVFHQIFRHFSEGYIIMQGTSETIDKVEVNVILMTSSPTQSFAHTSTSRLSLFSRCSSSAPPWAKPSSGRPSPPSLNATHFLWKLPLGVFLGEHNYNSASTYVPQKVPGGKNCHTIFLSPSTPQPPSSSVSSPASS